MKYTIEPQKGIAPSFYQGIGEIRGMDIFTRPGSASVNYVMASDGATDAEGLFLVKDSNGKMWALDDDGDIWSNKGGTWAKVTGYTTGSSGSLFFYKGSGTAGYIIYRRSSTMDVYDISEAKGWTDNWKKSWGTLNFTSGVVSIPLVANDNKVYLASGQYVNVIEEVIGQTFDPDNVATYSIRIGTDGLDLQKGWVVVSLEENSGLLYVFANNSQLNQSAMFPWDKVADSYTNPVSFGNDDIFTSITAPDNLTYVFAGLEGNIYRTNGSSQELVATLPDTIITRQAGAYVYIYPQARMFWRGKIYFATSYLGSTGKIPALIWSFDHKTFRLNVENTMSSGSVGTGTNQALIPVLFPYSDSQYMSTFKTGVAGSYTYGIDKLSVTTKYTGDKTHIIGQVQPLEIGGHSFQNNVVYLAKPLGATDSVKAYYRDSIDGDWKQIGATFTNTTTNALRVNTVTIQSGKLFQVKLVFNNNVEFIYAQFE